MCGGRPKAPKVKKEKPDKKILKEQQRQIAAYQAQAQAQQAALTAQLQAQIDAAAAETAKREQQLVAAQTAAANAAIPVAPTAAATAPFTQTTEVVAPKKKPGADLKIGSQAAAAGPGTGLNIGI